MFGANKAIILVTSNPKPTFFFGVNNEAIKQSELVFSLEICE